MRQGPSAPRVAGAERSGEGSEGEQVVEHERACAQKRGRGLGCPVCCPWVPSLLLLLLDLLLLLLQRRRRRRRAHAPLAAVPAILSSTQLVVCLPASLAALLPTRDLALQPLPFAQASVQIVAAWSRCRTNQPALKWILGRLTDICARFAEPVLMPGPKSKARRAFAQMV